MKTTNRKKKAPARKPVQSGRSAAKPRTRRSPAARPPRLPPDVAAAIDAAHDKKASNVVVLNLRKSSAFTDYFVLCTGQNVRQVAAIADAVEEALRGRARRPAHVEGYDRAEWVLMDYFDLIVHIFTPSTREFYALDRLWGQAERFEIPDPGDGAAHA
jgi:ribosome-associated protein